MAAQREKKLKRFKKSPKNVRFDEFKRILEYYDGVGVPHGTHFVFTFPGLEKDPLTIIRKKKQMHKLCVLKAIAYLERNGIIDLDD